MVRYALLFAALISAQSLWAKSRVVVVFSGEDKITLQDGKTHPTGFFLAELMGPVQRLIAEGYSLSYVSPTGKQPVMDKVSDSAFWWGDVPGATRAQSDKAKKEYQVARDLCEQLGLCGPKGSLVGSKELGLLSTVAENLDGLDALFVPGGHAPMEDLWKDKHFGEILRSLHAAGKPTALICHAPIALLASLPNPQAYIDALVKDDRAEITKQTKGWIYSGYKVTSFTTREEQQEEPGGADDVLGGYVRFYPDLALERAGAYVDRGDKWSSKVSVHNELVTGQNPFSHDALAEEFVKLLAAYDARPATDP